MAIHGIRAAGGYEIMQIWSLSEGHLTWLERSFWGVVWSAGVWTLWKERNRRLFSDKRRPVNLLIIDTSFDIMSWV